MHHLILLLWLPLAATTVWIVAGLGAVLALTRRRPWLAVAPPPVTVLKPLCGSDPGLRENLESFFRQDHPHFELVFGVTDAADPALGVVRELTRKYPKVRTRTIVHAGEGALNPKVDNLLGMLPHAQHELVLLSDSNVLAPRHYVREMASVYERERPGLVTNLFVGIGERSLGAALENIGLSGFVAAGVGLPTALGDAVLVGKSVLFSRHELARLGGMRRFSDVLAEDFVMAQTFVHGGGKIVVAPTIIANVTGNMSVRATLARQLRWSMLRCRATPLAHWLEPVASPVALLPVAWWLMGPWALAWALVLLTLRDVGGWLALRGTASFHLPLLLSPLRELLALGVWCAAPLKRHVAWRGKRFRLGAGTLLYQDAADLRRPRGPFNRASVA
jgi:ceramide glucosyltransferase